jgi:hypothetical protein
MPANTSPIFSKAPDVQWVVGVTAANTTKDLTSGTIYLVFTADATNGGRVEYLIIQPLGTNVQTVMRVWINNGGVTTTAANNTHIRDITLLATSVSESAQIGSTEVPLSLPLPAGYKIYVTIGTAVAAGFNVTAVGGKY